MELKVTKDYSFPETRRLVERSEGPVTYASVAAMSGGPRSTPRQTPRTRVQLDPGRSYSKYTITSNSPSSDPPDSEQSSVDVTRKLRILKTPSSKRGNMTQVT
jgi:hypothetical protein